MWKWGLLLSVLLTCGCAEGGARQSSSEAEDAPAGEAAKSAAGKRVVLIVAHKDFRDEELFTPRKILEAAGAKVTVASSDIREARGALGGTVRPDLLVKDINPDNYDALVFVGGPGAQEYWDDRKAHEIARRAAKANRIVAAICIAPVTLANAGLLDGRRATVWRTEAGRLRAQGADYSGRDVEVDGNIITANGPEAADKFGREIAAAFGRQAAPAEAPAQD